MTNLIIPQEHHQYLVEIDYSGGTLKFSGAPAFAEGYYPYLSDPGLYRVDMFSNNATSGSSSYGYGEIILNNIAEEALGINSGPLDFIKGLNLDGSPIRVYRGHNGQALGSFEMVYAALVDYVNCGWNDITITLRSKQVALDANIGIYFFLGDNIPPNGLEGDESLKDTMKPILLGRVFNATPVLCNASKLIYCVSKATALSLLPVGSDFQVFDNGLPLTYESGGDLLNTAPAEGCFRADESGYFRLGSAPAGQITFSGAAFKRSINSNLSNLIVDIFIRFVNDTSYLDVAELVNLKETVYQELGMYITSEMSISDVIDYLCDSVGVYWYFDINGIIHFKQFVDPVSLTVDYDINQSDVLENFTRSRSQDTPNGSTVHSVALRYAKNYTVQNSVAGSVIVGRKAWLQDEWRIARYGVNANDANNVLEGEFILDTAFTKYPTEEVLRKYNLYSVKRDIVSFDVPLSFFPSVGALRPGLCFSVTINNRFEFNNKKMVLVSYSINFLEEKVTLSLWG